MRYFPNVDPVYLFQRKGTADDPYIPRKEEKYVYSNTSQSGIPSYYVTLGEIPDYNHKVAVKNESGTLLTETTNETISSNEYKVDYTAGIVHFNPANNEQKFTFEYLGTGYVNFPADRVIMSDAEMSLQEFARSVKSLETTWHPPVENFGVIATSIPSPKTGDTVQTLNDGKVYRYEKGEWLHTQTYNNSAVADLQIKLAASLEDVDAGSFTDDEDDGTLDGGVF